MTDKPIIPPTILTASGIYINLIETESNTVLVADIAHALSHVCRFAGHTRSFYSVAQHCWLASFLVPEEDALAALFHDAAEAYIGDVASPLKQLLPEYRAIEARLQADIFAKLGLPDEMPASIKQADLILLATEQRDLMPAHDDPWALIAGIEPMEDYEIVPCSPRSARTLFLDRFKELAAEQLRKQGAAHGIGQ